MTTFVRLLTAFCLSMLALSAHASNALTPEQKLSDLNQLAELVKSGYGPLVYKKDKLNIDVNSLQSSYAEKLGKTKSNAEAIYTILRFIAEFHDGHFRANVPSELMASVPFDTDLIEGRVLIDRVDRSKLSKDAFPYDKGDEVVAVNGKPIADVLNELKAYRGLGNENAEVRRAAMAVTVRAGVRLPVPKGEVVFSIRRGIAGDADTVKLNWNVQGQALDEVLDLNMKARDLTSISYGADYDNLSIHDLWAEVQHPRLERTYSCSGGTRIDVPANATLILASPFVAYYWPTDKGNLGYLRIPHYSPEDGNYEKRFRQYEYAVSELEKNTVGLVIDQDHNCGGSVEYLHQIVSLFADKPFKPMQFQLLASKQEYLTFKGWISEEYENTLAANNAKKVLELIKKAWLNGDFMTEMTSIDGSEIRNPNGVRYTKPIVMLIDEMSGSGGDAFPSMMQGIGRAKLIGSRTMGLGGHVVAQPALFYTRIVPEMTKSLFYRPDGVAVENNGASPDFGYTITREDFMYGYRNYRDFYTKTLLNELK